MDIAQAGDETQGQDDGKAPDAQGIVELAIDKDQHGMDAVDPYAALTQSGGDAPVCKGKIHSGQKIDQAEYRDRRGQQKFEMSRIGGEEIQRQQLHQIDHGKAQGTQQPELMAAAMAEPMAEDAQDHHGHGAEGGVPQRIVGRVPGKIHEGDPVICILQAPHGPQGNSHQHQGEALPVGKERHQGQGVEHGQQIPEVVVRAAVDDGIAQLIGQAVVHKPNEEIEED